LFPINDVLLGQRAQCRASVGPVYGCSQYLNRGAERELVAGIPSQPEDG